MTAVKDRNRGLGSGWVIGLLMLTLGAPTALADRMTMADGKEFGTVWVQSLAVTPDSGPVFQVMLLQQDQTWSQEFPVAANTITRIEFRGPRDQNAEPLGRTATLTTKDGRDFQNYVVQSLSILDGKPTFQVLTPSGEVYPVLLEWISGGHFTGQDNSAVGPAAAPAATVPSPENSTESPFPDTDTANSQAAGDTEAENDSSVEEDNYSPGSDFSFGHRRATGFRGTLGMGIFWLGVIVFIIMRLWLWVMMFQTGILWGLSQLVPCLNLVMFIIWLIQNWSDAKMPFLILMGSFGVMIMGAVITI